MILIWPGAHSFLREMVKRIQEKGRELKSSTRALGVEGRSGEGCNIGEREQWMMVNGGVGIQTRQRAARPSPLTMGSAPRPAHVGSLGPFTGPLIPPIQLSHCLSSKKGPT